ncbi:MAG TPA: hypothetical protein VN683_03535, partial [Acidothermaceae bacterium]|nr:hypothetical protein [Acidothermaceae bacterium]
MSAPETDQRQDARRPRTLEIGEALAFAERQVRHLVAASRGHAPTYTNNGRWVFEDDPWAPNWSDGFFTGMMWAFAEVTGEGWWAEQAAK